MKNKYSQYGSYIDVESYKYGDYHYSEYSSKEFTDLINNFYTDAFESKEDKIERLAKEKAEKRNNKIDQILG